MSGLAGLSLIPDSGPVDPGLKTELSATTGLYSNIAETVGISTATQPRVLVGNSQTRFFNKIEGTTALFTAGTNQVAITDDGSLEIVRSAGNAYIDFKNSAIEDYDFRLRQSGTNQKLEFWAGTTLAASLEGGSLDLRGELRALLLYAKPRPSDNKGGEIKLAQDPNGTLTGDLRLDTISNKLRVFEGGGALRGAFLNIESTAPNIDSEIIHSNNFSTYLNGSYVQKTGDTMTGALTVQGNITSTGTGLGYVRLAPGTSTSPGVTEFFNASNLKLGTIGQRTTYPELAPTQNILEMTALPVNHAWAVKGTKSAVGAGDFGKTNPSLILWNGNEPGVLMVNDSTNQTGAMYLPGNTGNAIAFTVGSNQSIDFSINSSGAAVARGDVIAFSDQRLKTNVTPIKNALHKVLQLQGVEFDRVDTGTHSMGLIAQQVQQIVPHVVTQVDDQTLGVAYGNLVALLVEAIKELADRVQS